MSRLGHAHHSSKGLRKSSEMEVRSQERTTQRDEGRGTRQTPLGAEEPTLTGLAAVRSTWSSQLSVNSRNSKAVAPALSHAQRTQNDPMLDQDPTSTSPRYGKRGYPQIICPLLQRSPTRHWSSTIPERSPIPERVRSGKKQGRLLLLRSTGRWSDWRSAAAASGQPSGIAGLAETQGRFWR
jgi:hypothetical protein